MAYTHGPMLRISEAGSGKATATARALMSTVIRGVAEGSIDQTQRQTSSGSPGWLHTRPHSMEPKEGSGTLLFLWTETPTEGRADHLLSSWLAAPWLGTEGDHACRLPCPHPKHTLLAHLNAGTRRSTRLRTHHNSCGTSTTINH